jgi:hypothetical protein
VALNNEKSLSDMTAILSNNWKATLLATSLWEFFDRQLCCTVLEDDGEPNRHRIEGITDPNDLDKIRIAIFVRKTKRIEEGLVHELLHANLIPLGYPRFWIDKNEVDKWKLAGGIINLADHVVMRPIYLSFGYSEDRFTGPTRPLTEREKRVAKDVEEMGAELLTPGGYLTHVAAYLECNGIKSQTMDIASSIARRIGSG